jgi:hypothetical protein
MVDVVVEGKVKQRVLDIKYAQGPLALKEWTDIFIRSRSECPVIEKYSDYMNFPESANCYLMKSSMYYYRPIDLELMEISGIEKNQWVESEVREAYAEAFVPLD